MFSAEKVSIKKLKCSAIEKYNHDTYKYTFDTEGKDLGIYVCGHVIFMKKIDNENVTRKQTPISPQNQTGSVDFLVKIYRPDKNFPKGGRLTSWMEKNIEVGSTLDMSGPQGKFRQLGQGQFSRLQKDKFVDDQKHTYFCVAGGSGITPIQQLMQIVAKNKETTRIYLIQANKCKEDIWFMDELLEWSKRANFKIHFALDKADNSMGTIPQEKGQVSKEMIRKIMPNHLNQKNTQILCCGNPQMSDMLHDIFRSLGFGNESTTVF